MSRARPIPSSPQQADHHRLDEELLQYVGLAGADGDADPYLRVRSTTETSMMFITRRRRR